MVDIDDDALQRYGQWPWPRSLVALLLGRILEGEPRAVGVDILFAEPDRIGRAEDSRRHRDAPNPGRDEVGDIRRADAADREGRDRDGACDLRGAVGTEGGVARVLRRRGERRAHAGVIGPLRLRRPAQLGHEQLVQRLIPQETGIDTQRLRTGKLDDDEWPLFTHAIEVLSDTHIFLDDTPAITPLQLRTKCRRLHLEYSLDLVIVDYLQLMSGDARIDNRVQEVSYISRNLKVLARELNVPVLAAAQLSRAVEQRADKEPQLSDLRESGSLEQDADIVMFIHRPEIYEKDTLKQNLAQIKIAKHRNGPVGTIELIFRNNLAKFENAATRVVDFSKAA